MVKNAQFIYPAQVGPASSARVEMCLSRYYSPVHTQTQPYPHIPSYTTGVVVYVWVKPSTVECASVCCGGSNIVTVCLLALERGDP
jgi:hypothetical protein